MAFKDTKMTPLMRPYFGNVKGGTSGNPWVITLPRGATFLDTAIRCTIAGTPATKAQLVHATQGLATIEARVSGVTKRSITIAEHVALVEFYQTGLIGDSGYLFLSFQKLWMNGIAPVPLSPILDPAWGTQGESLVEIVITPQASSTIDGMELHCAIDPAPQPLGNHMTIERFTPVCTSAGDFDWNDLKVGLGREGKALYGLHIYLASNPEYLTWYNLEFDDIKSRQIRPDLLHQRYKQSVPNRTPQTGWVHDDLCWRGLDSDAVDLGACQKLNLRLTFGTAPSPTQFVILAEVGTASQAR